MLGTASGAYEGGSIEWFENDEVGNELAKFEEKQARAEQLKQRRINYSIDKISIVNDKVQLKRALKE